MVPAIVETVFLYPDGKLGVFNWILIKNIFLSAIALVALCTGAFVSINHIIDIYIKTPDHN